MKYEEYRQQAYFSIALELLTPRDLERRLCQIGFTYRIDRGGGFCFAYEMLERMEGPKGSHRACQRSMIHLVLFGFVGFAARR